MKKISRILSFTMLVFVIVFAMTVLVGCETTGNKRQNGTNTEHVNASFKNVTVNGNLTIGGAKQNTEGASQEGLQGVNADAQVKDSANGNNVPVTPSGTLTDSLKVVPSKQNVPNAK